MRKPPDLRVGEGLKPDEEFVVLAGRPPHNSECDKSEPEGEEGHGEGHAESPCAVPGCASPIGVHAFLDAPCRSARSPVTGAPRAPRNSLHRNEVPDVRACSEGEEGQKADDREPGQCGFPDPPLDREPPGRPRTRSSSRRVDGGGVVGACDAARIEGLGRTRDSIRSTQEGRLRSGLRRAPSSARSLQRSGSRQVVTGTPRSLDDPARRHDWLGSPTPRRYRRVPGRSRHREPQRRPGACLWGSDLRRPRRAA